MLLNPKAIIFDAYGTLFDVHSVIRNSGVGIPGDLEALSQLWRQKQLEYTWLRALMDRYEDFWHITEAALRSAVRQLSIEATDRQLESLMQAYLVPGCIPGSGVRPGSSERIAASHSLERVASDVGIGRPLQLTGVVFRRDHFRRQGENLQTLSPRLCAGIGDLEPSCCGDSFRFFQPMGRCGSQGVRLPGLLV